LHLVFKVLFKDILNFKKKGSFPIYKIRLRNIDLNSHLNRITSVVDY